MVIIILMTGSEDFSGVEQRVRDAFLTGQAVDLRLGDAQADDPRDGGAWGPDRQIRATVLGWTPCSLANLRVLQCVCPVGLECSVASMILCANPGCALRPRPTSTSHSASTPAATKRSLQSRQVCRLMPSPLAIALSDFPVRLNNWWVKMTGLLARCEAGSQVFLRVTNFKSLRQVASYAI